MKSKYPWTKSDDATDLLGWEDLLALKPSELSDVSDYPRSSLSSTNQSATSNSACYIHASNDPSTTKCPLCATCPEPNDDLLKANQIIHAALETTTNQVAAMIPEAEYNQAQPSLDVSTHSVHIMPKDTCHPTIQQNAQLHSSNITDLCSDNETSIQTEATSLTKPSNRSKKRLLEDTDDPSDAEASPPARKKQGLQPFSR